MGSITPSKTRATFRRGPCLCERGALHGKSATNRLRLVDMKDDIRLGLKSTAIIFSAHGKISVGLSCAFPVSAWSLGDWMLGISSLYAIGIAVIAGHLASQNWQIDSSSELRCVPCECSDRSAPGGCCTHWSLLSLYQTEMHLRSEAISSYQVNPGRPTLSAV
jgi:hypothetical protein